MDLICVSYSLWWLKRPLHHTSVSSCRNQTIAHTPTCDSVTALFWNRMLKNLLDVCGSAIAFYATGYALAYGQKESDNVGGVDVDNTSFIGNANFFLVGNNVNPAFFFFQFAFSATSTTIVAGTLAERCRMGAYLAFSLALSGFVYPVLAHNICTCHER